MWQNNSVQLLISAVMCDITKIFSELQKGLQWSDLLIPDVLTLRDAALRKLQIMKDNAFPAGMEAKFISQEVDSSEGQEGRRKKFNKYVTTTRNFTAIRSELIASSTDFLEQRLNIENDTFLRAIMEVCDATKCEDFISAAKPLAHSILDQRSEIPLFPHEACEQWPAICDVPRKNSSDRGVQYSVRLRKLFFRCEGYCTEDFICSPGHSWHHIQW